MNKEDRINLDMYVEPHSREYYASETNRLVLLHAAGQMSIKLGGTAELPKEVSVMDVVVSWSRVCRDMMVVATKDCLLCDATVEGRASFVCARNVMALVAADVVSRRVGLVWEALGLTVVPLASAIDLTGNGSVRSKHDMEFVLSVNQFELYEAARLSESVGVILDAAGQEMLDYFVERRIGLENIGSRLMAVAEFIDRAMRRS